MNFYVKKLIFNSCFVKKFLKYSKYFCENLFENLKDTHDLTQKQELEVWMKNIL